MKKYKLLNDDTIKFQGTTLYRIQALMTFSDIVKGDLGGYIECEDNLSHLGKAWVYGNAKVYGRAWIGGNAELGDNAEVCGDAEVCGNASVQDSARVYGYARVCDNAWIYDNAQVFDTALVYDDANVRDNAQVFDTAFIHDKANVCGEAKVYGNARVYGNALVYGDAVVCERHHVQFRLNSNKDNVKAMIAAQTGLRVLDNGKFYAYKHVRKDLSSLHDPTFKYKLGKIAKAKNPDTSNESCASGLHVSYADYWSDPLVVMLYCECDVKDVITVQEGKIRLTKIKPIAKISDCVF